MRVDTSAGEVVFVCHCGTRVAGGPEAACLSGTSFSQADTRSLYRSVIANSVGDRTTHQIARTCPRCGVDHLSVLVLGENMLVVVICDNCRAEFDGSMAAPDPYGEDPAGAGPADAEAPAPAAPPAGAGPGGPA